MQIKNKHGYLEYTVYANHIDLEHVEVDVESRGQGVATQLVNELLELAKEKGLRVELCAVGQDDDTDTDRLIEWYESLGFERQYEDVPFGGDMMFFE